MSYGAGAAGFPNRNRAALALIFGMHMLALLGWMQQRRQASPSSDAPQVVSILLQLRRPAPVSPPSFTVPIRPAAPPAVPKPHVLATAPDAVPAPVPAAVPALEEVRTPIDVRDAIREQREAEGGFSLGLSRRQAGRIDRELRKGKSGVPDEPDTPMGRFRRGLEAAHIERSMSAQEDSYTSPDGVIIYRRRIGNATICRRSGSINPLGMRGMLFANEAGDVPCPTGVQWKKD